MGEKRYDVGHIDTAREKVGVAADHFAVMAQHWEAVLGGADQVQLRGGSGETGHYQGQLNEFVELWVNTARAFATDDANFAAVLKTMSQALGDTHDLYRDNEQAIANSFDEIAKLFNTAGG